MKGMCTIALLAVCLIITLAMPAFAGDSVCNLPEAVKQGLLPGANAKNLDTELKEPLWVSAKNHFEICGGDTPLVIKSAVAATVWPTEPAGFKLNVPDNGQKYFVHKLLIEIDQQSISGPVLKIEMGGKNATLVLEDIEFKGVVKGIQVSGEGIVSLKNISINGVKSAECIIINTAGTTIDALTANNCSTGVLVGAKDVTISNSEITGNTVGVQIASGILRTKTIANRIYGNTEEIKIADGPSNEIVFFKGDEESFAPVIDIDESAVIEYTDTPAYLNIVLNGASSSDDLVTIEFFISESNETFSHPQASKLLPIKAISVPASKLAAESIKAQIPVQYRESTLTAILDDPRYGSTGFSHKFVAATGDVVAFVEAPFDMTTTGGGMDGAGTSSGGYEVTGSDVGGGVMGNAAPKGCGAQLVPAGAMRTTDVALTFWWILFAGAVLGGLRTAAVRVRRK